MDDGISDAGTIARAMSAACSTEHRHLSEVYTRGANRRVKAMFLERRLSNHDDAIQVLLKMRAQRRAEPDKTLHSNDNN